MLKRKEKTLEDVRYILDNIRKEDLEELKALWGENWREQTIKNIMETDFLVLVGVSDKPVVMGGIWETGEKGSNVACVWLLSTDEVKRHKTSLLKEIRKEIKNSKYSILYNFIYKTNHKAKKWLKLSGFRFDNPFPDQIEVPEGFEFFYRLKEEKIKCAL